MRFQLISMLTLSETSVDGVNGPIFSIEAVANRTTSNKVTAICELRIILYKYILDPKE